MALPCDFFLSPMAEPAASKLGAALKARRRAKRLTLRDLSDEIGVSFNTLSRVERGHIPDLKNFQRIVDWLEMPAEMFTQDDVSTPEIIARHLRSDRRLSDEAAASIMSMVDEMYRKLVGERPQLAIHLRSARTFTPAAGALLANILEDFQSAVLAE
jgi:transcriptional regulator with XRE-family HTH domain